VKVVSDIYNEQELEELEQEEHSLTEEALVLMFATLYSTKRELIDGLRDFYHQYGQDGVITYAEARKWVSTNDRRKRINVLSLFVAERFSTALDTLVVDFNRMVESVIKKEGEFFGVDIDLGELPLKWGYDHLDWYDRLEKDINKWNAQIRADIKRDILQRKHLDEILQDLEDRFESMESVLEALGISETTAVGSLARNQIFKELGIGEYQFYTRVDERRCEICGEMHGKVFPMSAYEVGVTASPMHPRCRCWEVPIKP
jgi:SPP1 gp7 family putative phage head morphogenesis protein